MAKIKIDFMIDWSDETILVSHIDTDKIENGTVYTTIDEDGNVAKIQFKEHDPEDFGFHIGESDYDIWAYELPSPFEAVANVMATGDENDFDGVEYVLPLTNSELEDYMDSQMEIFREEAAALLMDRLDKARSGCTYGK